MPTIKVRDLAWARLHAPDLDAMEEFLTHFGLIRAARTPTALFMRTQVLDSPIFSVRTLSWRPAITSPTSSSTRRVTRTTTSLS